MPYLELTDEPPDQGNVLEEQSVEYKYQWHYFFLISKAGKPFHTKTHDHRPISFSSFLLQILKRVIEVRIRAEVDSLLLSSSQYAYTRGEKNPCKLKNTRWPFSWTLRVHLATSTQQPQLVLLFLSTWVRICLALLRIINNLHGVLSAGVHHKKYTESRSLESSGNNAIAYANDIGIAESGICPQMLSNKLNLALSIILDLCGVFGYPSNRYYSFNQEIH